MIFLDFFETKIFWVCGNIPYFLKRFKLKYIDSGVYILNFLYQIFPLIMTVVKNNHLQLYKLINLFS